MYLLTYLLIPYVMLWAGLDNQMELEYNGLSEIYCTGTDTHLTASFAGQPQ